MARSSIKAIAALPVSGPQVSSEFYPQRVWDRHGTIQIEVGNFNAMTADTLFIAGRMEPNGALISMAQFSLATFGVNSLILKNFQLPPVIQCIIDFGVSSPLQIIRVTMVE